MSEYSDIGSITTSKNSSNRSDTESTDCSDARTTISEAEQNKSHSTLNYSNDFDMEKCVSSTPLNISTTIGSYNPDENTSNDDDSYNSDNYDSIYNNATFNENVWVEKLRFLISDTLTKVELCSDEMSHIVKTLRENSVIE